MPYRIALIDSSEFVGGELDIGLSGGKALNLYYKLRKHDVIRPIVRDPKDWRRSYNQDEMLAIAALIKVYDILSSRSGNPLDVTEDTVKLTVSTTREWLGNYPEIIAAIHDPTPGVAEAAVSYGDYHLVADPDLRDTLIRFEKMPGAFRPAGEERVMRRIGRFFGVETGREAGEYLLTRVAVLNGLVHEVPIRGKLPTASDGIKDKDDFRLLLIVAWQKLKKHPQELCSIHNVVGEVLSAVGEHRLGGRLRDFLVTKPALLEKLRQLQGPDVTEDRQTSTGSFVTGKVVFDAAGVAEPPAELAPATPPEEAQLNTEALGMQITISGEPSEKLVGPTIVEPEKLRVFVPLEEGRVLKEGDRVKNTLGQEGEVVQASREIGGVKHVVVKFEGVSFTSNIPEQYVNERLQVEEPDDKLNEG